MTYFRAALIGWVVATVGMTLAGCGDDGDGAATSANVAITSIEPPKSYPGLKTRINFEITPRDGASAGQLSWEVRFGDGQTGAGESLDDTVTHVYESSGQYPLEVVALAGGSPVGRASESLQVLTPVDVAVSAAGGSPANVQAGDDLTVSCTVSNEQAGAVQSPFDVSFYLSSAASVSADDLADMQPLGIQRVTAPDQGGPVISAGGSISPGLTATVPDDLPGGDYNVVAWVNPEGQLSDTNASNNFHVATGLVRVENSGQLLADLAVEDVLVAPTHAFPTLNKLTRGFTISNTGSIEGFDAVAKAWLSVGDSTLDADSDTLLEETDPFNAPPNNPVVFEPEEFVLDDEITPPAGGEAEVYLIIEVSLGDHTQEADLDNNVAVSSPPIVVSDDPVDGTDIVVRDFDVTPDSTFLDGSLEASLTLANEGVADAGSFFCGLYLGAKAEVNTNSDPRVTNINVSSLTSDAVRRLQQSFTVPALYDTGTYYMYVVCDPQGALSEPYRSNNQKIDLDPITITDEADVDLYVDSLTAPATASQGNQVDLIATLCVDGANPSGHTTGQLWRSPSSAPDFSGEPIADFDIPNINPGACKDVTIPTPAECSGFIADYGYGIAVDTNEQLPESDETNNRATAAQPLTVDGPYCSCTADSRGNDTPNQAFSLAPGQMSESLCHPETCDYYQASLEQNDSILVTTTFDSDKGELETELFDTSRVFSLDKSVADDRQEVSEFLVSTAGEYVFSVCGSASADQNLYDLDLEVLPPSIGVDVLPRDLQVPQRDSFSIGAQLDVSFRVYNIGQVDTASAFDAQIVISPNNVIGDGDDIAMKPSTLPVDSVKAGSSKDVNATVTIPTSVGDGDYYVGARLDIADTDATNNWVTSKKITVETLCYDPLEPNDSMADARSLSSGSYSNLAACTSADDYYEICVQDGKKFSLNTSFFDNDGDIDVELYDSNGQIVDSSANSGVDTEQVNVDYVNGDQCYYARVYLLTLQQTLQTTYDMSVNVQDVDPALLCDGLFEPNNSTTTASNLIAALQRTVALDRCPVADVDYYYVSLAAGQRVSLRGRLDPSSQSGTLGLQLYKPNGAPGPNQQTAPGSPVAEITGYTAPTTGIFHLQVTQSGTQRRGTYTLEADGIGGIDLAASNLSIGPGSYTAGDQVRYGFDLANLRSDTATAPTYKVWLGDTAAPDPASDTELDSFTLSSDVAGNSSTRVTDKVYLPAGALSVGTHYLHVEVAPSGQTDPTSSNDVATTSIAIN